MTLFYLAGAWLAGIVIANAIPAPWWAWTIAAVPAFAGIGLAHRSAAKTGFACLLLCSLGAARFGFGLPQFDETHVASYNGIGFVTLEGTIADSPDVRDTTINLKIRVNSIALPDGEQRSVSGTVLARVPRTNSYRYGDPVSARGELVAPPHGEDFSYRDYLARDGVYSLLQYGTVTVTGERVGNPLWAALLDFRAQAHANIQRLLPDPESSLLAGILLGIESGISPQVREDFNTTGAAHIIAISGANLAILAGVLHNSSRRFMPETASTAVTIIGVAIYAVFVGGDAAVLRAAVMTTLALVAARLGRQTYGFASLAFAAMLLTAINPLLLWDVGFQLSFMATLGLIIYVEPLQRGLKHLIERFFRADMAESILGALADPVVVTLAAQITTAPILAYHFERFSIVSLPVNLLIVPVQSHIMILGGLGVILSMIVWPVGQVLAWASWVLLAYTVWVVKLGASLPFAEVPLGAISPVTLAGIYLLIFGTTWYTKLPEQGRHEWRRKLGQAFSIKLAAGAGALTAILLFTAAWSMPDGKLHVIFVDVGEGGATLIETPSGRHILVDAGGSGRSLSTAVGDALPFWKRDIDVIILTQPTESHISGLVPILERYETEVVITNGARGDSQMSQAAWNAIEMQGAPIITATHGMQIRIDDGAVLTVLRSAHAPSEDERGDPLVVFVTYRDVRILLTGDLDMEAESALLSSGLPLHATALQVPRSGHRESSSETFLAAVKPQMSILTVGSENNYGLPHEETLARLQTLQVPLYRTDQMGTIYLTSDGERVWVTVEH